MTIEQRTGRAKWPREPPSFGSPPVHAINASLSAAPEFLRGLAARGGGEYVELNNTDPWSATERLRHFSPRVLAVEHDPDTVAQVFPEVGTPVDTQSATLVVTGILRNNKASVRVKLGFPDTEADATTIALPVSSHDSPSTLAARAWALAKIDHLATAGGDNRADIRRTAQQFRIVTPDTSLIVLETARDYARYGIEPPAGLHDD